ncbi:MAG: sodium pump decarboxylase subunit gamma [Ruminococcaceae bacterium]|nr:sodium pump decarboxylase subunit gamma [Oscillospiraceae bacterium]
MMWSTLVTGIVVVFLILILLVFILWAMGKVLNLKKKPKNTPAEAAASVQAAPMPVVSEPEIEEYDEDDGEIIAVIAAAIAAYGEADGKQYRIASVKRKEKSLRSNWSAAGINENTRPF